MPFLRMDEVRKFVRIANKEHRRVVADHIPVAFVGVELEGEAAHIALGVCCAALPRYGGEAQQAIGFLANFREDAGLGVLADIVSDSQCAVSSRAFGVDGALGNALAILMCEFFKELVVLHQERSARTGCNGVLVVRDGISRRSGHELGFVDHRLNLRCPQ